MKILPADYKEIFRLHNSGFTLKDIKYIKNIAVITLSKILNGYIAKSALLIDPNLRKELIRVPSSNGRRRNTNRIKPVIVDMKIARHHFYNIEMSQELINRLDTMIEIENIKEI